MAPEKRMRGSNIHTYIFFSLRYDGFFIVESEIKRNKKYIIRFYVGTLMIKFSK